MGMSGRCTSGHAFTRNLWVDFQSGKDVPPRRYAIIQRFNTQYTIPTIPSKIPITGLQLIPSLFILLILRF